jgi:hypothetical protein
MHARFIEAFAVGLLTWIGMVGCTSTEADHPACDIRPDDTTCTVDADCEYVGTRIEATGQCCYDPCGSGAVVNQAAAKRLVPERDRINTGPPRDGCSNEDRKCRAGWPTCTDGRCTVRPDR